MGKYKDIEVLVKKSKNGDHKSKEILLKKLEGLIFNSVKKHCNIPSCYEDLIQDGRLIVLESIKKYRPDKGVYFLGYVKLNLKYYYINLLRKEYYRKCNIESLDISLNNFKEIVKLDKLKSDFNLEEYCIKKDLIEKIKENKNLLTDKQRLILYYFYYEKYSIKKISKILNIKYRTVVNIKSYAINKLKSFLKK